MFSILFLGKTRSEYLKKTNKNTKRNIYFIYMIKLQLFIANCNTLLFSFSLLVIVHVKTYITQFMDKWVSILYRREDSVQIVTVQKFYNFCLLLSINIHLKFKILQKVFRYLRVMYNYSHNKKENHLKVIESLSTTKTYIQDKRRSI